TPLPQRRVGGDARAQQRRGDVEADALRDAAHEGVLHHDLLAVAAVGVLAVVADAVVGRDVALDAELLGARPAVLALTAGVDHAADPDPVADLELRHVRADRGDGPRDLVPGDH